MQSYATLGITDSVFTIGVIDSFCTSAVHLTRFSATFQGTVAVEIFLTLLNDLKKMNMLYLMYNNKSLLQQLHNLASTNIII